MREDERLFLLDIHNRGRSYSNMHGLTARQIINEKGFPINYKRAWYLLQKWSSKGWYDWGVNLELGWLTPDGEKKANEIK